MITYIFEDLTYKNFLPLCYTRPIFELRCGVFSLREKIQIYLKPKKIILITRPNVAEYLKEQLPEYDINIFIEDDSLFINGRIIADYNILKTFKVKKDQEKVFYIGSEVAAVYFPKSEVKKFFEKWKVEPFPLFQEKDLAPFSSEVVNLKLVSYPWDLISHNGDEIINDFNILRKTSKARKGPLKINKNAILINKKNIFIGNDVVISPCVTIDASEGSVVIENGAKILPQCAIIGPAHIGKNTIVKIGAKIYSNTSIGEVCKVGGEIDSVIMQSYSNKQHDGYLGHAYVGSWVNFGAGTNNSDLKNNYSNIKVIIDRKLVNTSLQHFGMIFGDHSKTGINMMFDTGTVVGIGCNLYGAGLPPRFIPSFVRGTPMGPLKTNDVNMVIETEKIVMHRRNKTLTKAHEELLKKIFNETVQERQEYKIL